MPDLSTIDIDLTEAERVARELGAALAIAVDHCDFADLPGVLAAAETWTLYCRPSCGYLENGTCSTGDIDVCGCPCLHDETVEV
jgi:hypothetical protein